MVKAPRKAPSPSALRPLNLPESMWVEEEDGWPVSIMFQGRRYQALSIQDVWRVEEEWWRSRPVSRTYFEVILDSGNRLILFKDHMSGNWYSQRYG